ncbi:hypothetical protein REPUB_Repub12eG0065700 [Reevesia pubescens]
MNSLTNIIGSVCCQVDLSQTLNWRAYDTTQAIRLEALLEENEKYGMDVYRCKGVLSVQNSDQLHALQAVREKYEIVELTSLCKKVLNMDLSWKFLCCNTRFLYPLNEAALLQLCLKNAKAYGHRFLNFLVWTMQVIEPALSDVAARFAEVEFVKINVDELPDVA